MPEIYFETSDGRIIKKVIDYTMLEKEFIKKYSLTFLQVIQNDAVLEFIFHNSFTKKQKQLMQSRKWRVRKKWQNEYRHTRTKFIAQKVEKGIKKVEKSNGNLSALYKS